MLYPYVQEAIRRLDYEESFIYDEELDEKAFMDVVRYLADQVMRDGVLKPQTAATYRHGPDFPYHSHAGAVKDLLAFMLLEDILECRRRRRSKNCQGIVTNCSKLQH